MIGSEGAVIHGALFFYRKLCPVKIGRRLMKYFVCSEISVLRKKGRNVYERGKN